MPQCAWPGGVPSSTCHACSGSFAGSAIGCGQRQSYGLFGRQCGHGCTYSVLRFTSGGGDASRGGGIYQTNTINTKGEGASDQH